jgi:hypothetical protein
VLAGAQLPKAAKLRISNGVLRRLPVSSLLLGGLGNMLGVELNDQPTDRFFADIHIEKHARL